MSNKKSSIIISRPNFKQVLNNKQNIAYLKYESSNFGVAGLKAFVESYGCQGNVSDAQNIKGILIECGYQLVEDKVAADLIVFNSCAIRQGAQERIFGVISSLKGLKEIKPELKIVLCGCVPQEEKSIELILNKYPYIDLVLGTHNIYKLPNLLQLMYQSQQQIIDVVSDGANIVEDLPRVENFKHKSFVDIMYGCDKFCSYCIVPYTRGKQRSRRSEEILAQCQKLVDNGCLDITLIGQNVNAYGKDMPGEKDFGTLLNLIATKTKVARLRFVTSHPWDFSALMINALSEHKNIMPSLHLPLQSGSDQILAKMLRRYTYGQYKELYLKLKEVVPNIAITTDLIVGFPQETDEDFKKTLQAVEELRFDGAYTFIYSSRENTPASRLTDSISPDVKKERLQQLNKIVNDIALSINQQYVDTIVEVLVDGISKKDSSNYTGYSKQLKPVNFSSKRSIKVGDIVLVKITQAKSFTLDGIAVEINLEDIAQQINQTILANPAVKQMVELKKEIASNIELNNLMIDIKQKQMDNKLHPSKENKKVLDEMIQKYNESPLIVNFNAIKIEAKELSDEINAYLDINL
jgi:tRNA-2-methylthio-N6-dimethylallyladenosine synthase